MTTLSPIMPPGGTQLTLSDGGSYLLYKVPDGHNRVAIQLDTSTAWTAGAAVSVQAGLLQAKQYAFDTPVSYTSVGLKPTIELSGGEYLRLYMSAVAAGTDVVTPVVKSWREVA